MVEKPLYTIANDVKAKDLQLETYTGKKEAFKISENLIMGTHRAIGNISKLTLRIASPSFMAPSKAASELPTISLT